MKVNVRHCARCEQDHDDVEFKEFSLHPIWDGEDEESWTHWAMCPTLNEPIILHIYDVDDDIAKAKP